MSRSESTTALNGETLRAAREALDLSVQKAAKRVPMDPSHLSRVERGIAGLSVTQLYRLSIVLRLDDLTGQLEPLVGTRRSA